MCPLVYQATWAALGELEMPVIRMSDTTTTTTLLPPEVRESFLTRLKKEFEQSTEGGPVIFEIPLGTECFDVLVVWQDWAKVESAEDRTRLILDAYGEKQEQIAQALGVTYEEAMQQQLLPYTIVSTFEKDHKLARLACNEDEGEVEKLLADIRNDKRTHGGIVLPNGEVELRFPTRAMVDNTCEKLRAEHTEYRLYWSVAVEVAVSHQL
jgi:hypothetical protein